MNFNFDWNCVSSGAPYVTISTLGISFNTPAIALLGNPEDIVIGFDESQMIIGIKDAKNMTGPKAYKFISRIRSGWIKIGCKDFIKYLSSISKIDFAPAKKYVAQFDKNESLLYIVIKTKEEQENDKDK
jgi:hypothetical protein